MSKMCWVVKEYKKGWKLGLAVGNKNINYLKHWFKNEKEIARVLGKNIAYIHLTS